MSKIFQAMKMGEHHFRKFCIEHILGRVWYCEGDGNSYYWCPWGRNQRVDGPPATRLELKHLAEQVRSSKEYVPQFLRDQDEDDQGDDEDSQGRKKTKKPAGPHWIRWVVTQPFYHEYVKKRLGEGRRLVGMSLSPIFNPGPDEAYLVVSAPPIYDPVIRSLTCAQDYENYVRRVNFLKIPGTDIGSVRWTNSFMFWVRFDGDIPSFITYMVASAFFLNPCGWAPGKVIFFSGKQGCGKSETLTFWASLANHINLNDNCTIEQLTNQFNMPTCKTRLLCHEAGAKYERRMNDGVIRTLISDSKAAKPFNGKFLNPMMMYGCPMLIIAADRTGEGSVTEQAERRHAHVAFAKDPKEPSDYKKFHKAVQLYSRLMSQVNPNLNDFREDFRKCFLEYIAIYFDVVCPTGLKIPNLFQRRDFFDGCMEDADTGAAAQTITTSATKRAKTSTSVAATYADAVNSMCHHLAVTGSIFPVEHPDVFAVLFKSLVVFSETDTLENKSNFTRRCLQATWMKDISSYSYDDDPVPGTKHDDTLVALYEQWKVEDGSDAFDQSPESKAHRNQMAYRRMLTKFKACLMIEAWLSFDKDSRLQAWPRLLSQQTALWLIGVWINFKAHNNRLNPSANPWGGNEVNVDVEKLGVVARLMANRLSGRQGFQGPRETTLSGTQIAKLLGLNISGFLGIGHTTLSLKAISLTLGSFSILKNLIVHVSSTYRPSEDVLERLVERCGGEMCITDQDRVAYDSLLSATKSRLMDQLAEFYMDPDAISKAHEEERIFYVLYMDLFSGGPMGIMKKTEFYDTLTMIDEHVKSVHSSIGYRPTNFGVFRNPAALGESPVARREVIGTTMPIIPVEDPTIQVSRMEEERQAMETFVQAEGRVSPMINLDAELTSMFADEGSSFGAQVPPSPDGLS